MSDRAQSEVTRVLADLGEDDPQAAQKLLFAQLVSQAFAGCVP